MMTTPPSADPPVQAEPESILGLRPSDQRFLGGLLIVLTLLLGVYWGWLNGWFSSTPASVYSADDYEYTLEINSATWVEWAQLDGIGETLARRIVQDREERGPFRDVDDVNRVKGIGDKTMTRIRPHLRCLAIAAAEHAP